MWPGGGNREVIAEPAFLEDESSPTVLQRFARGRETRFEEIGVQAALAVTPHVLQEDLWPASLRVRPWGALIPVRPCSGRNAEKHLLIGAAEGATATDSRLCAYQE
jgi:hypothetical protein